MNEWITDRKPSKDDSPIIGCSKTYSVDSFDCAILKWENGWDGEKFYDHSNEYGMEIEDIDSWKHFKIPERITTMGIPGVFSIVVPTEKIILKEFDE